MRTIIVAAGCAAKTAVVELERAFNPGGPNVLHDNLRSGKNGSLTAYISGSQDREGNTFYNAAICDDEKHEIVRELDDYDREELEKEVLRQFPEIEIENG